MTRLLRDAKLPRDKTVSTLDLNRFAAPLRGQIRQLLRGDLDPARSRELMDQMRAAGLPI